MANSKTTERNDKDRGSFRSAADASRDYFGRTVQAAKDNPGTAAAIGAGVVAAVAAGAYGATKLRQRDPAVRDDATAASTGTRYPAE